MDLAEITSYLHPLGKTTVFKLGLVMGLDYNRLKPLIDSPDFLEDMLAGWLEKVDQVQKTIKIGLEVVLSSLSLHW